MRLYLIRHGKTDSYLQNKRQSPDTPLGKYGLEQSKIVAKRLKNVEATVLLCSNWPRAIQTAEVISKETGLPIELFPDLHEQEKPKSMNDISDNDPKNLKFIEERSQSGKDLDFNWKFEGEGESMNELLVRARGVCNSLASEYKNRTVIAVTHGIFIAALVTTMIFGNDPDKKTVIDFFRAFNHQNTGITILDYDEDNGWWSLVSLNDHSHLT